MRPDFMEVVRDGQAGLNEGLPNVFNRFNKFLYGTQKRTYYAVGGLAGSGKSAFVDDNFVLSPYFYLLDNQKSTKHLHWHYYSFELDYISKRARWTAYRIYQKLGILCDSNYILSKGKNRVSGDMYQKIAAVADEIDVLFDHMTFVEDPMNPTGIFHELMSYAETKGKFHTESYNYKENGTIKTAQRYSGYTPNSKEDTTIIIIDHVALTKPELNYNLKQLIDKLSQYLIWFRNKCGHIPVAVVQFNRGLTAIERIKFKKEMLLPTLEDFKDTGNIGQDCNVALGMFNPFKMDFQDHLGYPILPYVGSNRREAFEDKFRAINIMKNRDGDEWRHIGMHYLGGPGMLRELPQAGAFTAGLDQISKYTNLNYLTSDGRTS